MEGDRVATIKLKLALGENTFDYEGESATAGPLLASWIDAQKIEVPGLAALVAQANANNTAIGKETTKVEAAAGTPPVA